MFWPLLMTRRNNTARQRCLKFKPESAQSSETRHHAVGYLCGSVAVRWSGATGDRADCGVSEDCADSGLNLRQRCRAVLMRRVTKRGQNNLPSTEPNDRLSRGLIVDGVRGAITGAAYAAPALITPDRIDPDSSPCPTPPQSREIGRAHV